MDDTKKLQIAWGKIITNAWESKAYAEKLRSDPKAVMKEAGIPCDESKNYIILEMPEDALYIVKSEGTPEDEVNTLPPDIQVPDGVTVRFWVNTADTTYLVLPPLDEPPLSEEELEQAAGGRASSERQDGQLPTAQHGRKLSAVKRLQQRIVSTETFTYAHTFISTETCFITVAVAMSLVM